MSNRRSLLATVAAASLVAIALGSAVGVRLSDDAEPPSVSADGSADLDAPAGDSPTDDPDHRPGTKQDQQDKGKSADDADEGTGQDPTPRGGIEAAPTPTAPADDDPAPSTTVDGVTVLPEAPGPATDDGLPGLEDESAAPSPYQRPEATAFARGRLVAGYPVDLLPSAPRSSIVSSSVAPSSDRVQVALLGRRSTGTTSVQAFYRGLMADAGFRETSIRAVAGAEAVAFRRGPDRVVVTIDPDPARTYSVYATLVVEG